MTITLPLLALGTGLGIVGLIILIVVIILVLRILWSCPNRVSRQRRTVSGSSRTEGVSDEHRRD